ncbi:MAG: CbiX/SirB N-terminal domain-containing protein [Actinomycetes bacterium]
MTTALLIVDHGSRRAESNTFLNGFAVSFSEQHKYEIVETAHMELAEPSIGVAFDACIERGATKVVVCPFFLLPGNHWRVDIPALTQEAADRHPGVEWLVTAPIGLHSLMGEVLAATVEGCIKAASGDGERCKACGAEPDAACNWK